jgi:hypothetical protein
VAAPPRGVVDATRPESHASRCDVPAGTRGPSIEALVQRAVDRQGQGVRLPVRQAALVSSARW